MSTEQYEFDFNKFLNSINNLSPELQYLSQIDGETLFKEHCKNGRSFGERGWTIPLNSAPSTIALLLRIQNDEEFNKKVAGYIEEDLDKNCIMIRESNIPNYFKNIFEEAHVAMKNNLLFPSITAMTSLCEGMMAFITRTEYTSWIKQIDNTKRELEAISLESSIQLVIYSSIETFIKEYFADYSDFEKQEPFKLNRHWLMHGRTRRNITIYDYYKLFNLLTLLVWHFGKNEVNV